MPPSSLRVLFTRSQFAFQSLFGIGRSQSFRLCGDLGLNPYQKLGAIPDEDFEPIKHKIETTFLPKHEHLKRIGEWRGARRKQQRRRQRMRRGAGGGMPLAARFVSRPRLAPHSLS